MKSKKLLLLMLLPASVFSQQQSETFKIANRVHSGTAPAESSFTAVKFEKTECLTDEQRLQLRYEIARNRKAILEQNPDAFKTLQKLTPFQNPFRPKAGFTDYGYHTLQYQVDHNLTPNNNLLDYNCGTRTYDWTNGNHQGTDFILWPYPWKRMQENTMEIVAAAGGIIVDKRNTSNDLNCTNNGNPSWNGVVIEHADGSFAVYMHFKKNSATTKEIGDTVTAGEFLGLAGSSGSSTIPHLHFEIRDAASNVIDPYQGACNSMNSASWWQQQENYYVPRINRISTHSSTAQDNTCPVVENTYEKVNFNTGDLLVLKLYYRDIKPGDVTNIKITDPNGSVTTNFDWTQNWGVFYPTAHAFWSFNVTSAWMTGVYNVQATFGGNTYTTVFGVRTNLGTEESSQENISVYPNPVGDVLFIKSSNGIESAEIIDLAGRIVMKAGDELKENRITVATLIKGTYLLKFTDRNQKVQTVKFTKK